MVRCQLHEHKTTQLSSLGKYQKGTSYYAEAENSLCIAVDEDVFYKENTADCIRFTKTADRNINKQPFDIITKPCLKGKILSLPKSCIELHHAVTIALENINGLNVGAINIKFKNACFNSLGFLTQNFYICKIKLLHLYIIIYDQIDIYNIYAPVGDL